LQGNVVAYGEANIEIHDGADLTITGNFLLNPRGPAPRGQQIQCWSHVAHGAGAGCRRVTIANNYALSSRDRRAYPLADATEDSINLGFTRGATVSNNFISGGHSTAGCGLIADKGASDVRMTGNRLVDTGQCGIGIADGTGNVVENNRIYNRKPVAGGGNSGIYVWQFYGAKGACANTRVSGNVALALKPDGSKSGFWKGQGCDPLVLSGNRFGAEAAALLAGAPASLRPPAIPPAPDKCVVRSPYSNNRSRPMCEQ
jgi:parallel beta-helix repeat protein